MSRPELLPEFQNIFKTEEKETKQYPIIFVKERTATIEVGGRCFTNCDYCYIKNRAIPMGKMLTVEQLVPRLDWLQKFTDINEITLLGGEVLLNPDFPKIVEEIRRRGLYVNVITSGVYNRKEPIHRANADYLIEQYSKGGVGVVLSYQPNRNERAFSELFQRLRGAINKRRASIGEMKLKVTSTGNDSKSL